ncbi:MAG: Holliday junction DNA helicase RuvB [Candidatus Firestonebacteria bacterium RIFOXYC2_FULL_39_67]|nr:MAG: Holliday junction DNA helicase RuvB [Candidatus Firestonebacteria bacterium RIFOXYD2_FULL_39_29]OGF54123.1 MAG: Holliday junction DNA helicase RuvB [Candidatus Firestonebacteria bacterium RIFOXYC2_FULL_39_67]OGF54896.1 MAG: Holliday junction DNA helicase RuvB [Candidatus Firestonebacteria bacterium RifOxyC12_full_39_7]
MLDGRKTVEDIVDEKSLRPQLLSEYIGQDKIKENLSIFMTASKQRGEPLEHVLFYGPPGLGKTTLSYIVANEMKVNIRCTSGPLIERAGDLAAILTNVEPGSVLFIDEIHRLPRVVEEVLYSAMEDYKLDIIIGKGPSAKTIRINLPKFTLVGATTRAGLITSALRDRFGMTFRMDFYPPKDLAQIIKRSARILKADIQEDAILEIARRSRGTPRVANRLLKRVRDFGQVKNEKKISLALVNSSLASLDIDDKGLDSLDKLVMNVIIKNYAGGPVGIESIAVAVGEEAGTIEDVCEPFLIQLGFLIRTPQGRKATAEGYKHMNVKMKEDVQGRLI